MGSEQSKKDAQVEGTALVREYNQLKGGKKRLSKTVRLLDNFMSHPPPLHGH